jgi:peptide/nickel transport system substrate-binding protein
MLRKSDLFQAVVAILVTISLPSAAGAQKPGGILKMYSPDSPASVSIQEEADGISERVMMGVFNNLVIFDQHVKQNTLQSIHH